MTHYRAVLAQLRWCELVSDVTFGALWMPMGRFDNVRPDTIACYIFSKSVSLSEGSPGGQPQHSRAAPLHAAHYLPVIILYYTY